MKISIKYLVAAFFYTLLMLFEAAISPIFFDWYEEVANIEYDEGMWFYILVFFVGAGQLAVCVVLWLRAFNVKLD